MLNIRSITCYGKLGTNVRYLIMIIKISFKVDTRHVSLQKLTLNYITSKTQFQLYMFYCYLARSSPSDDDEHLHNVASTLVSALLSFLEIVLIVDGTAKFAEGVIGKLCFSWHTTHTHAPYKHEGLAHLNTRLIALSTCTSKHRITSRAPSFNTFRGTAHGMRSKSFIFL